MPSFPDPIKFWYAVRVKPRHEQTTALNLSGKGIEQYLPLYRSRRKWTDRIKQIEQPLFPGYLFCRIAPSERTRVLSTPGIYNLVGFGSPAVVPDEEIGSIQRMQRAGLPFGPWPYLRAGERVRIEAGPLAGLEGVLASTPGSWRVVVNVELLQRSVAVTVERGQVRVLRSASACA